VTTRYMSILCIVMYALSTEIVAQESSCPNVYSDEQSSFIGHMAFIGLARSECPNLNSSLDPILGHLAQIWGEFPSSEFDCPIWQATYREHENQAAFTIVKLGLKSFCEQTMSNYGPGGRVFPDALYFTVNPTE